MVLRIAVVIAFIWAVIWWFAIHGAWVGPSNTNFAVAFALFPAAWLVAVAWALTRFDADKFLRWLRRR
jgi:type VI protein secretion system component VasK